MIAKSGEYVVKSINADDLERAIDIWSMSFGFYDRVRWRTFFETYLNERFGVYHDDYLVSIAGIIHFEMWLGDKLVPCGGISAVSCDPAFRRQGLIRECLRACLQSLYDKRVPVSTLWPFSYPFYQRLGYEVSDFKYTLEANLSTLPDSGDSTMFRKLALDDFEQIAKLHDLWIAASNMSLRRSKHQWIRLVNNPQRETSIYASDKGYMLWNTRSPKERTLEVVEFAYLNRQAFLDGLSLVRRMDDLNFDKVEITLPSPEPVTAFGMTDPQMKFVYKPGVMARVVHTQALLETFGLQDTAGAFKIEDPLSISPSHKSAEGCPVFTPGRLIQTMVGINNSAEAQQITEPTLLDVVAYKKPFCVEFF